MSWFGQVARRMQREGIDWRLAQPEVPPCPGCGGIRKIIDYSSGGQVLVQCITPTCPERDPAWDVLLRIPMLTSGPALYIITTTEEPQTEPFAWREGLGEESQLTTYRD